MSASPPPALLLAAGPDAPGAAALVERFLRSAPAGGPVLLSGPGLAWREAAGLAALVAAADVAVCSQDARRAGWSLESTPQGVRWSSVATWLAELDGGGRRRLWTALP